jgi:hypothetical protein
MSETTKPEDWKRWKSFADLIEATTQDLRGADIPSQLSSALDGRLGAWREVDAEFAAVLEQVKGQAWSMDTTHLRAVREKLIAHLEANLAEVKARL